MSKSPYEFEHLVVNLLEKMGYGGQVKDAGSVTQASNDGGIDGIIKEDILGLGRIHIQAKRYSRSNTIGREEVQKFVGALAVAQSNKGIFITTSSYSKGACEYANNLNGATTLILINGLELANYIYDYNLGMQVEQIIELKKLDNDYWDGLKDDV
ncbi:MAG: restriction endonuclease [Methylococcales bacterium]